MRDEAAVCSCKVVCETTRLRIWQREVCITSSFLSSTSPLPPQQHATSVIFTTLVSLHFFCHCGVHSLSTILIMKSFATLTAGLVATTLPSLTGATSIFDIFKRVQPESCHEGSVLCPGCDGRNITDDTGDHWAITCDFAIEAETEKVVGGDVSTSICLDSCDDDNDCFGVTFAPNGSCVIASGEQKGLSYSSGYTNFARLASSTTTSSASHTSTKAAATTKKVTTTTRAGFTTTKAAASSTPVSTSGECDLDGNEICPKCAGQVATDSNGKSYRVLCDTSINSNGSYSPQEWLSPEECLEECDKLDFCTGVTYNDERNCELAKANPSTVSDASFTAFLPVATPAPSARAVTSRTQVWNVTTSTPAAEPTFSILPISSGCNPSAVTCDECDGYAITDRLNGSYTAVCGREPMCVTTDHRGNATQEECLQKCDQDAACLAAIWSADSLFCNLCLRGLDFSTAGGDLGYVVLAADMDGKADDTTTTITSSVKPTLTITRSATTNAQVARSITDLPAPFPETSAIGPVGPVIVASLPTIEPTQSKVINATSSRALSHTTPVACPAADNSVYVDPGSSNRYAIGCDNRFDAAHSAYVTASNFEACAAQCTASCDGVQFGVSSRCGLYTDITFIGAAEGWTAAARLTRLSSSATATSVDITSIVSASATAIASPSFTYAPTTSTFGYRPAFTTSRRSNGTTV